MSYKNQPSNGKSQPKFPVWIFGDLQNVSSLPKQANLLLAFAKTKGRINGKTIYYNSHSQAQVNAKSKLENYGFNCFDVPCNLKNSADNQLIADCIKDIGKKEVREIVILVSGDGDFAHLVNKLQELGKKVIIFAQRGNVKQRLIEIADEFYFLEDLPKLIKDETQYQTTSLAVV